jgi:hypothetical protein
MSFGLAAFEFSKVINIEQITRPARVNVFKDIGVELVPRAMLNCLPAMLIGWWISRQCLGYDVGNLSTPIRIVDEKKWLSGRGCSPPSEYTR